MGSSQPKDEAPPPQAQPRGLQPALPLSAGSVLNKIIAINTTAGDMPDMQDPSSHHCPLLKLPPELRLEIFRLTFQHYLDIITSPARDPRRFSSANSTRGALALLDTCRAIRAESVDAMEPQANVSKSTLQSEIHRINSEMTAAIMSAMDGREKMISYLDLNADLSRLNISMAEMDMVCRVLAQARTSGSLTR